MSSLPDMPLTLARYSLKRQREHVGLSQDLMTIVEHSSFFPKKMKKESEKNWPHHSSAPSFLASVGCSMKSEASSELGEAFHNRP
jgi:hypothetical protein